MEGLNRVEEREGEKKWGVCKREREGEKREKKREKSQIHRTRRLEWRKS